MITTNNPGPMYTVEVHEDKPELSPKLLRRLRVLRRRFLFKRKVSMRFRVNSFLRRTTPEEREESASFVERRSSSRRTRDARKARKAARRAQRDARKAQR